MKAVSDFRLRRAASPRAAGRAKLHPSSTILHPFASLAFSLVEVVLALGIVSFCLIAVIGLMPVGLKSVKNANDQAGAADVLNAIADSLRTAVTTNSVNYSNSFAGKQLAYVVDPNSSNNMVIVTWTNLTLDGAVESSQSPKRLSASVIITPPVNSTSPGHATVSVAWSAQAIWNPSTQAWANSEGSITSGIQFLPRP